MQLELFMRVMMFSQNFPGYHYRAGEPTWFVEKIKFGMSLLNADDQQRIKIEEKAAPTLWYPPKYHSIRVGTRWKVGDKLSARIWEGTPYRSKQLEFAQLTVKKVWPFEITLYIDPDTKKQHALIWLDEHPVSRDPLDEHLISEIAANDGLALDDFDSWFEMGKRNFRGQIICWADHIKYLTP